MNKNEHAWLLAALPKNNNVKQMQAKVCRHVWQNVTRRKEKAFSVLRLFDALLR